MEKSTLLTIRRYLSGFLLTLCLLAADVGFAQEQSKIVTGTIKDETGQAVPGVSIQVKGTSKGTMTDGEGKYSLQVSSVSEVLVFSFIGYTTQETEVGTRTNIDVLLEPTVETLSEVVVTGYQTQRKSDLTGAIASVDMSKSKDNPSGSALQNIQGKVPGVYITVNGSPSGAAASVNIRGANTLGNTSPLYVIDGVPTTDPNTFQFMDQASIESIQVLKDASAASIYGSRASNGVIIVTTKQGKDNISVTVNSSASLSYNTRRLDMMNTMEYGQVLWQASVNDNIRNGQPDKPVTGLPTYDFVEHTDANGVRVLDQVIPKPFLNNDPNLPSADTDWQDEVYRPAVTTQNTVTLTAGTPRSSSLISFGYYTNSGLAINNEYKRYNARINNSMNFFDAKLKIGENLQIIKNRERPSNGVDNGTQATWNDAGTARTSPGGSTVIALTNIVQPILPVRKLDGTFAGPPGSGFSDRQNPVALADLNKWDINHDLQVFGNLYAEYTPIDNLVFRSSFGLDYTENYDINIEPSFQYGFLSVRLRKITIQ
ncbi:MAG: SusC/RagA family TonB-linked outer membrane protein [Chryseolinea sp.]